MPIRPENRERYPKDWKLRSRFVREYRAKNRCEWCRVPNYCVVYRTTGRIADGPFPTYAEARQAHAELYASRMGVEGDVPTLWSVVVLTVAHVYDDRPEACSLLNLAALCQRCHNRHDMKSRRAGIRERARAHTADLFA
jgi:5-methylcytosine-specific restriction endonuclease McrA